MGTYTELRCDFRIRADTPAEVIAVLEYMVGQRDEFPPLPNHPLFSCERWEYMLQQFKRYLDTESLIRNHDGTWRLNTHSEFKNYDSEIDHFFNWIAPYIVCDQDGPVGWQWCEDERWDREATKIYVKDGKVEYEWGKSVDDSTH